MTDGSGEADSMRMPQLVVNQGGSGIRTQLLWATLFPMVFFVLLSTLVISTTLYQITNKLVTQRNTAQVQIVADALSVLPMQNGSYNRASLEMAFRKVDPKVEGVLYLIDSTGFALESTNPNQSTIPLASAEIQQLIQEWQPASKIMESIIGNEESIVSFAPIQSKDIGIIITEPWSAVMSPAYYYQAILTGLLVVGVAFSLIMLSVSIERIIRPIANLAENATGAVPGSIFHPVPERGPQEIRGLINAFNQMVIRLAEQQGLMRQYADKALLSQEEERQRLSHELHDGTLQDLVGLSQRVELCKTELERSPELARGRLDELHHLLGVTIQDVRRISNALRPPILEDFGLSVALDALCKDLRLDKPDLDCRYLINGKERRLQPDLELAIYRVVQEALANIRKHAQDATLVQVELTYEETHILVRIKNNGNEFSNPDLHTLVRSGHLGLAGMFERARLFEGNLEIQTDDDKNTVVSLQVPCCKDTLMPVPH